MKEEWRDVVGYEGIYQVSSLGRVKSLPHKTKRGIRGGKILKLSESNSNNPPKGWQTYLQVCLSRRSDERFFSVHRLVAEAFIPNPENKKTVNHKDGNRHNNNVDNLEWASQSENIKHSFDVLKRKPSPTRKKAVVCLETGEIYETANLAAKALGYKSGSTIKGVCHGYKHYKTAHGYHWKFQEDL